MQVCVGAGIRIPGDLSLIASEDTGMARGLSPALSAVRGWNRNDIQRVFQTAADLIEAHAL